MAEYHELISDATQLCVQYHHHGIESTPNHTCCEITSIPGTACCFQGFRCIAQVGSVEIERVILLNVEEVQQAAAVSIPPQDGGPEQLVLFVVPSNAASGAGQDEVLKAITEKCRQAIREHLNPLFKLHWLTLMRTLPRNASNKVMRRVLRDQALASASRKTASKL